MKKTNWKYKVLRLLIAFSMYIPQHDLDHGHIHSLFTNSLFTSGLYINPLWTSVTFR